MSDGRATSNRVTETEAAVERGDCIFPRCYLEMERWEQPFYCGCCGSRSTPFDDEFPDGKDD